MDTMTKYLDQDNLVIALIFLNTTPIRSDRYEQAPFHGISSQLFSDNCYINDWLS